MKRIFAFILLIPLLTACPGNEESTLKKLQANNMDLPELEYVSYEGIKFKLSKLFDKSFNNSYAITRDNADCREIRDLNVIFSVERFTKQDADEILENFDRNISAWDAVHDFYLSEREESLRNFERSIKKEVEPKLEHPTYIETIIEQSEYSQTTYFIATMNVAKEYYVFQFIGSRDAMGYLYDDFIDLLASVQ